MKVGIMQQTVLFLRVYDSRGLSGDKETKVYFVEHLNCSQSKIQAEKSLVSALLSCLHQIKYVICKVIQLPFRLLALL